MLKEKLSVNVGDASVMYIEMYSLDTPDCDLKYGDCKYDDASELLVWYGMSDESDMSGWVKSPWSSSNYSAALIETVAKAQNSPDQLIYRIMNNDISFDETLYLATTVGTDDE